MTNKVVVNQAAAETRPTLSRRVLVRSAAWSAPVVATVVATPLATASGGAVVPINSDIVLSFVGGASGSTRDITDAVIAFVKQQLLNLGPQVPPEPVEPPKPTPTGPEPKRSDYPAGSLGTIRFNIDHALWERNNPDYLRWLTTEYPAWQAERIKWAAENAEKIAQRLAWEAAIWQLEQMMNEAVSIGEMLFSASISYPQQLVVTNSGPELILPGTVVTVTTTVDSNLINAHLPSAGGISLIQTGGTTTLSYLVTETVPVGGVIFTQPLAYNPASVTLNIRGSVQNSSVTAQLDPNDQDTNPHGNVVSAPIGVTLNVLTGDLEQVLARWEQLTSQVEDLKKIWDLISPYIDWNEIISGVLPLPQLP